MALYPPYKGSDENNVHLHNQTFDFFSIDFVYRWHFSPGSDLFLTWKNFALGQAPELFSLGQTINETFVGDKNNAVTLKVLYYFYHKRLIHLNHLIRQSSHRKNVNRNILPVLLLSHNFEHWSTIEIILLV